MSSSALFFPPNSKTEPPPTTFFQALSNATHDPKQENAAIYVHPLVRKSSAKLSIESLEMCTESLGSETGCNIKEEIMIRSSSTIYQRAAKSAVKVKRECKYPPPLTSVSDSVSVESYRENGRLLVNAVVFMESSDSLFQAERIGGRLTLRFKKEDGQEDEFKELGEAGHSVSGSEDMSGNAKNMEGNSGSDENMSNFARCNETRGQNANCRTLRKVALHPEFD